MREVGAGEFNGAAVREALLERDHRDDQADESEPEDGGKQAEDPEEAEEKDRGSERDHSERRGLGQPPARNGFSGDDAGGQGIREARGRCPHGECKCQPRGRRRLRQSEACGGRRNAQSN